MYVLSAPPQLPSFLFPPFSLLYTLPSLPSFLFLPSFVSCRLQLLPSSSFTLPPFIRYCLLLNWTLFFFFISFPYLLPLPLPPVPPSTPVPPSSSSPSLPLSLYSLPHYLVIQSTSRSSPPLLPLTPHPRLPLPPSCLVVSAGRQTYLVLSPLSGN